MAVPTWQSPNNWLSYSKPAKGPDVLTVAYKTDALRKVIYRYDATKNPAVQTSSGQPIYVITSTGISGDAKRTLVSEVFQDDIKTFLKGSVVGRKMVQIVKDAWLCGYNHSADTPTYTDFTKGRNGNSSSCNYDLANKQWELGADDVTGAWSEGVIENDKKGAQYGTPAPYQAKQGAGYYTGAWDAFGMTAAEFYKMLGPPINSPPSLSGKLDGVRFYDADGKSKTFNGTVTVKGANGEGFLYVEGDLQFNGDFVYRGLIYATGKITVNGRFWVLGAVASGDKLVLNGPDGEMAILYSHDAIAEGISTNTGPVLTLSWREKP
jgi:hypothetical protein